MTTQIYYCRKHNYKGLEQCPDCELRQIDRVTEDMEAGTIGGMRSGIIACIVTVVTVIMLNLICG